MGLLVSCRVLATLILILPYISCESVSREKLLELKHYGDQMDNKGILDFGDKCNFADDLKRREIARTIPALLSAPTEESINGFIKEIQDFLDTGRSLCNAKFLLACDEVTERCECGPKSSETFYTREHGICRWAERSQCVSMELFQGTGVNAMCASHTKCTMEGNDLECNIENLVKGDISSGNPPNCYCSGATCLQMSFGLLLLALFCLYR